MPEPFEDGGMWYICVLVETNNNMTYYYSAESGENRDILW
jgi:hypothetical protein